MWPFRRASKVLEVDASRVELLPTQRENTMQYGWQGTSTEQVKDALLSLLERPAQALPKDERPD